MGKIAITPLLGFIDEPIGGNYYFRFVVVVVVVVVVFRQLLPPEEVLKLHKGEGGQHIRAIQSIRGYQNKTNNIKII